MDVEPSQTTSAHSSTFQSWPLSHAELASLVAEEVAGTSNAEHAAAKPKKAKIKPSLLKGPCAAVRSPLANVGLARTARCRPEIDFDNPPYWMEKLAADAKRCRATRCISEFTRKLGIGCSHSSSLRVA